MNIWNFFDAIFCINLESQKERYERAKAIFEKYNIPVTFFKGIKDSVGERGCLASHKAIYNLALQKGYNRIVIFEDDIIPTEALTVENLKYCIQFMGNIEPGFTENKIYPWDIFYFGAVPDVVNFSQHKTTWNNIYKIRGICCHAYALNRNAMQKLKDITYHPDDPLDYIIKKDTSLQSYAHYPSFFYQETGYNLPEFFVTSGLRINEGYAYHLGFPFKYVLAILIVLTILYFIWKRTRKVKTE